MPLNRIRLFIGGLSALTCAATMFTGTPVKAQTLLDPSATVPVIPAVFFGGTQLGTLSSSFIGTASNGQTISGTLLSSVYSGGTGATGLDFYYQFSVAPQSTQSVGTISLSSWTGAVTLVGQTTQDIDDAGPFASGGTASSTARRNGDGSGVQFNFGDGNVQQGTNSVILIVRTDQVSFTDQGAAALLGSAGVSANTTGQVLAVTAIGTAAPEPGTIALLLTAGVPVVGIIRRRAKR